MADSSSPLGLLGTLRLLLNSFPPDAPPYCVIGALAVGAWGQPRATKDDAHEREALTRRVSLIIEGQPVWMATPEDLILLKLKACRDRDLVDALSIVLRQASRLDLDYLWRWRIGWACKASFTTSSALHPHPEACTAYSRLATHQGK